MLKNKYVVPITLLLAVGIGVSAAIMTEFLRQPAGASKNFTLYGTDIQQNTPQTELYVNFPSKLTQQQQLEKIATLVSRYKFCQLPIEVVSLKDSIATINLSEHPWVQQGKTPPSLPGCSGRSWRYGYFQGSAGGYSTSVTLARTFVQPQYQGKWIKGVQFYYEGKPIKDGDWDHIELHGLITRQNSP